MKRLVLLVEGEGDTQAVPTLVGKILPLLPDELQGQLFPDDAAMKVGGIHQITGDKRKGDLARHLQNATRRPNLGAALLVLDGDAKDVEASPFCAVRVAQSLATRATDAGAGRKFSFAAVFLRQEYESLFLAVPDQLPRLKSGVVAPAKPEEAPRDAKGWLDSNLADGYLATDNQNELTRSLTNLPSLRSLRSFRRLEHALAQLAEAIATGRHIVSPLPPTPEATGN